MLGAIRTGGHGAITALAAARPDLLAALGRALDAGDDEAAERASAALAAERHALGARGRDRSRRSRRAVRAALAERGVDYPAAPRAAVQLSTLRPPGRTLKTASSCVPM